MFLWLYELQNSSTYNIMEVKEGKEVIFIEYLLHAIC